MVRLRDHALRERLWIVEDNGERFGHWSDATTTEGLIELYLQMSEMLQIEGCRNVHSAGHEVMNSDPTSEGKLLRDVVDGSVKWGGRWTAGRRLSN